MKITIEIPDTAYRSAIHNQIHASVYCHVSCYERSTSGKLAYAESWGYRGRRNALGMSGAAAKDEARRLNIELGWDKVPAAHRPKWLLA